MTFNTYEDLMAAVDKRRTDTLTLEVDLGGTFSQEYEDAKAELQKAEGMKLLMGGQGFLGDNIDELKARVEELRPEPNSVWVRFKRLSLGAWSALVKQAGLSIYDQYEKVLPDTFVGIWGADPQPDEAGDELEPLSTDAALLSSKSSTGILPGGAMHQVVQAFMAWQNSGGEVTIRPTRSGRV